MTEGQSILDELLDLGTRSGGRRASANSRIYADLNINGSDFIEFVEEVERLYEVDLAWVSPREPSHDARDPTIQELAENVLRQRV